MSDPAGVDLVTLLDNAVAEAFCSFTAQQQQQREDLLALTMSGLGGCTRQAAYRLARTPPSEEMVFGQMREANIGTMIHEGLLPHLAPLLGGTDEIAVTLHVDDLTISGRTDLYSERHRLVGDLKTVGPHKMAVIGDTPIPAHRVQVAGYALAVAQSGKPVKWIAWIYMDRASGDPHVIVEEFGDEVVDLVQTRCRELMAYGDAPDTAPRDERGPGLSIVCDQCPWLRQCWGEDAVAGQVGAQRVLVHDDAGVAEAIRMYIEARAREKKASEDKEFAKAMFADFHPGEYGDFQFYWSSPRETTDKDAALRLLADAGIPIPRKSTSRRLVVKRTRRKDKN